MLAALNRLVELIESQLDDDIEMAGLAREVGTTEYHLRRMFSSLAGMPLSDYIRRRRMTLAAADVVAGDALLDVAVRYGYGSTEAFGRAFHAVHGVRPADARRDGGPLRTQPQLRFRLTVEGTDSMHTRIAERPAFWLVGHAVRVPLIHRGVNPHIQQLIASLPAAEHERLKALGDTEPAGLLQVSESCRAAGCVGSDGDRMVPVESVAAACRPVDRRGARARRRLQHRDVRAVAPRRAGVGVALVSRRVGPAARRSSTS